VTGFAELSRRMAAIEERLKMPGARTIIDGNPGQTWRNDTDRPWFQLAVQGAHTCGLCYQYMNKIARFWPIRSRSHPEQFMD
jgi:hypothetical protein